MKKNYTLILIGIFVCWNCYIIAQPKISSFSPSSGPIGSIVTITGSGFNAIAAKNSVFFGSTKALISAASTSSLTVVVPSGASYQPISVTDLTTNLTVHSFTAFIPTFPCGGSFNSQSFATKKDSATNKWPHGCWAGDLDGDGKPDIGVANANDSTISIFKNNSTPAAISLSTKVNFKTANGPVNGIFEELDGDGLLDMVVVNSRANTISVFLNSSVTGIISFKSKVDYATGNSPDQVIVKDIDGDGKSDIVVSNSSSKTVSVFKNVCTPGVNSFMAKMDFTTDLYPRSIACNDVDGDQKPDLVLTGNTSFYILQNLSTPGTISFSSLINFPFGTSITGAPGIAVGDLDGDNLPDISLSTMVSNKGYLSIYKNTSTVGTISFAPKSDISLTFSTADITLGDVDGDGKVDIGIASQTSPMIWLYRNLSTTGNLSFANGVSLSSFGLDGSTSSIRIGDLDGDNKPDIYLANNTHSQLSIYKNLIYVGPAVTTVFNSASRCSGSVFTADLTSTVPSTFTWYAIDNPRVTGETTTMQTTNKINDTLVNISDSAQLIKYKVIATSIDGKCIGQERELAIGIYPNPRMLSTNLDIIPDGGSVDIAFTSNVKSTYKWKATDNPNVKGESITERKTSYIEDTLTLLSTTPQVVNYTVTPVSINGCGDGYPQAITVTVNIIPTITSFYPHRGPVGTTVTIKGTHFNPVITNNIVFFGTVEATVLTASETQITVLAPLSSTYQVISVTDRITGLSAYTIEPFVPTFPNCYGIFEESFFEKTESFSPQPYAIATGDLNDDGKPDMILGKNGASPSVSVFLNTSTKNTISFSFQQNIPSTIVFRMGLALADMDGDGKRDIIILGNKISILRNTSAGGVISFSKPVEYATGIATAESMTIGDLNRDGKPEIILIYSNSQEIGIFRNKSTVGTINFRNGGSVTLNSGRSCAVAIGDINNDSWPDLIVTDQANLHVNIFLNRSELGRVEFDPYYFPGNTDLYGLALGDLDDDGKTDIITANNSSGYITVYKNSTTVINNPTYDTTLFFKTGKGPLQVLLNDVDGDGKLDVAVLNSQSDSISFFKNTSVKGKISLNKKVDFPTGKSPKSMIIVDLDGDLKPDLISTNAISENLTILENRMDTVPVMTSRDIDTIPSGGTITISLKSTSPATYTWIANDNPSITGESLTLQTTDTLKNVLINNTKQIQTVIYTLTPSSKIGCGTGYPQTVTIKVFPTSPTILSFSPPSGPVGTKVTITGTEFNPTPQNNFVFFGSSPAEVVTASATSLVVIAPAGTTLQTISVTDATTHLTGYSSQPFHLTFSCGEQLSKNSFVLEKRVALNQPKEWQYTAIGDLDGDGKLDLVVTEEVNRNVSILRNTTSNGQISFDTAINYYVDGLASGIFIRDLDGDGKPDLVITALDVTVNAGFTIMKNTSTKGAISFAPRKDYLLGGWHQRIAVEDLDKDGKPDIVTANYRDGYISMFKNKSVNGTISFSERIDSITGESPFDIAIADLDGDAKPELLSLDSGGDKFSVLKNNSEIGKFSFSPKVDYATVLNPASIHAADMDGDGKLDVIAQTATTNDITIHRNNSSGGNISFDPRMDISSPEIAAHHGLLTVGDIDGDNKPDLLFAGGVYILKNTSSIGSISFAKGIMSVSGGTCLSIGDIDLDGKQDLVLGYNYSDSISILRNMMCLPTAIIEDENSFFVDIYPNPFTSQTTIEMDKMIKGATLQLIDVYGKEIRKINFTGNKFILEKEGLSPGIYFIRISSSTQKIINRKIIIN